MQSIKRLCLVLTLTLFATGTMIAGQVLAADWYDPDWVYRKMVTIDSTEVPNTDQSNFPVLINTTDVDWRDTVNGGQVAQSDGGDILFTDSDGTTKLDHEIEKYDPLTGELIAWVEVPTVSASSDTDIYIYYGNTTNPTNQWDINGTWDEGGAANFEMVQHMEDTTTSTITDSTSNNNDGTKAAANEPIEIDGKIEKGQDFDGSDDYIEIDLSETFSNITLGTWIKPNFDYDASDKTLNRIFAMRGDDNVSLLGHYSNVGDSFVLTDRDDSSWSETGDLAGAGNVFNLLEASDGALYTAVQGGNDTYKSTDGGDTWVGVFDVGWAVGLLEASDGAIYVGTSGTIGAADNVHKSTDGGATWNTTGGLGNIRNVAYLLEMSDGALYAGGRTWISASTYRPRVWKSTNGGDTWVNVGGNIGTADVGDLGSLLEASNGALYVTAGAGNVFKSINGGNNWVNTGNLSGATNVYTLLEASDGNLYAGTSSNGDVFKSTDGGNNWVNTGNLSGATNVYTLLEASDGNLYAGTYPNGNIFKSTDFGDTWVNIGDLAGATRVYSLLESSNGTIYAGTNGNVFKVKSNVLLSTAQSFSADDWIHLSFLLDGSSKKIFIDGVEDASTTYSFDGISSVKILLGGDFYNQDGDGGYRAGRRNNFFNGLIDEVRISNTARLADWIKTSYNNQSSPSTFYSIGSEDAFLPDLIVSYLSIPKVRKNRRGHIARVFVDYRVINQGYDDAVASELDFYLSRDTVLDGSDTYVGTVNIPALASGEETHRLLNAKRFKLSRPVFSSGTWYLLGVADAGDDNVESDETNNVTAVLAAGSGR